jgi:uncharacterized protein (TIGR04255 family)
VICQLRFPPILRIDAELPATYQESIRQEYPLFQEKAGELPAQVLEQIAKTLPPGIADSIFPTGKAYEFRSDDKQWIVSLTKDFLALTSTNYRRWEDFKAHLKTPFEALIEHYKPAFFSRIGLRYQNQIQKSTLGLENHHWSDLLTPVIAAELNSPDIATDDIEEAGHIVVIRLEGDLGRVRMQHGLSRGLQEKDRKEKGHKAYLIDNDFFTEQKTENQNAWDTLDKFNQQSGRLFRWCITDQLHKAMEPQPVGAGD